MKTTVNPHALETAPSDEQKRNLEDWLSELSAICRRYRIYPDAEFGEVVLIDMDRATIIGFGMNPLTSERGGRHRLTALDCAGSILDGVWPIDTPEGPVEQRAVQSVWPEPDHHSEHLKEA